MFPNPGQSSYSGKVGDGPAASGAAGTIWVGVLLRLLYALAFLFTRAFLVAGMLRRYTRAEIEAPRRRIRLEQGLPEAATPFGQPGRGLRVEPGYRAPAGKMPGEKRHREHVAATDCLPAACDER